MQRKYEKKITNNPKEKGKDCEDANPRKANSNSQQTLRAIL